VNIEDNGRWFAHIDGARLFEKYTTGGSGFVGLGMGLYLCRKIIEMHQGQITAGRSEQLGWALFSIIIPAY
jgi:signal transduction histidine kinase